MESWYWDLSEIKNSPSFKAGIDNLAESRRRTEGVQFINKLGQLMKLRYVTSATGTVYFHRFYMYHSFAEFHENAVAAACLFLAGKVEETPKKAKDLLRAIQCNNLMSDADMLKIFGEDPKEELMTMERILLKTIKFDLQVDHPYKFVLKYAKTFLGERAKIEKVVQNCWGFINDSFSTTLCLQWEPEIVAIALMDLSCRITKYEITSWNNKPAGYNGKWWDQFVSDLSLDLLESICHQVLDLYSPSQDASKHSSTMSSKQSESSKRLPVTESAGPPPKMAKTDAAVLPQTAPSRPQTTAVNPISQPTAFPSPVTNSSSSLPSQNFVPPSTFSSMTESMPPPVPHMLPSTSHNYTVPPGFPVYTGAPPPNIRPPVPVNYPPPYFHQHPPQGYYNTAVPPDPSGYQHFPAPGQAYPPSQHHASQRDPSHRLKY